MDDDRALALLTRLYAPENRVYRQGRHEVRIPTTADAGDLAALAARGLAPNACVTLTHDEAVTELRTRARAVDEHAAADAFVASLGSAPVRWRALLPATVLGSTLPGHAHDGRADRTCDVCFVDPTVTVDTTDAWRSRRTSGSPLPGDVVGYVLALRDAPAPWPRPTPHDVWTLHEVFRTLRELPPGTRPGAAAKAVHRERLLPGRPQHAVTSLLEDLALLGVLQTPEHPGLLTRFTTARERDRRPSVRVEVSAPLGFWTAEHGVDAAVVERLFGHLPVSSTRPAGAPPASPSVRAPRTARAEPLAPHLRGDPAAGDVYAVGCREDAWVLAYCHGVEEHGGRRYGRVEYLDGVFDARPGADVVAGRGFRGRPDGRWQQLTSQLSTTPRVRRLARDVPAPPDDRPAPTSTPFGTGASLRHMADWCFPELRD
ncbi:hypothetical protein [Cellulomonas cellasea]|uniref:Uncharacterized protein n=2 Tax=Cellulomonas cellasea TaxID=43670 RepID=A0A0A0BC96_9CELL|nr:hypothetical protein [Cellulomonas cellasea]KGM03742.1 hypothetical protein Q760_13600 [Cellulomonas cellasea DSM 20118]GEA86891.1 hypothetical protein CCE01nite_08400 [Cellulomonas cellasea]